MLTYPAPAISKWTFLDQNAAPAISGILAKYAFRIRRGSYITLPDSYWAFLWIITENLDNPEKIDFSGLIEVFQ